MGADVAEQTAQALWYVGPGRAEIRPEPLGALAPGHVRVRALTSAISRGTEALIAAGRVPETEYERMRAPFMAGRFPFPVKYGYASVGVVEAGPAELLGGNVFALYPHQTIFDVPAEAVVPVPAGILAAARGAGGQHGNRAERNMGCGTGAVRSDRGGRRRRGWRAGRIFVRPYRRRCRDAGRCRSVAGGIGADPWTEIRLARQGADRLAISYSMRAPAPRDWLPP